MQDQQTHIMGAAPQARARGMRAGVPGRRNALLAAALLPMLAAAGTAAAQEDAADLARAAQNPLASLVTLPLQTNYNLGVGPYERTLFNLNVQPVVPFKGEKWNVIARTIIPINSIPMGPTDSTFGVGDTTMTLFFTPAQVSGKLIWGVGPVFGLPTASNPELLGSGKWGIGPSAVVFLNTGAWTMGAVASNLWSFAGDGDRDNYNLFTAQWFVNYNFGQGWAVGTAPIVTANWNAEPGNKWTVPLGVQVSKLTRIGKRPVNVLVGYYGNVEHPEGGADRQVRVQLNFMFPTQ
jgi:hypothetical protein